MEVTLHKTPRFRDVVLEQIRIVGAGLRRVMQVMALVFGIVTVIITIDIVRGDAATWFDSGEWAPIAFASFLLPFAIWRTEKRFGPGFLWTLPVDRRHLALARVFAGWVWLMSALVVLFLWQSALAMVSRVEGAETVSPIVFLAATAMYLFGSAFLVGLRYPLRWLFGGGGVIVLLGYLNEGLSRNGGGIDPIVNSRAFATAFENALPILYIVWLAAGFVALWAAASRQSERRRH
jgi:hypothetical protein